MLGSGDWYCHQAVPMAESPCNILWQTISLVLGNDFLLQFFFFFFKQAFNFDKFTFSLLKLFTPSITFGSNLPHSYLHWLWQVYGYI